jgi:Heterokaryon incompatibility protein (HET)
MDIMDIDATSQNLRRRLPSSETLSKENVQMILEWISQCKTHHLKCRLPPSSSEQWLPTRLLDVGSDNGAEPHLPRVVETRGIPHAGLRYAALSHMWGDVEIAPPLRTMQHNYYSVREAIQFERLPQNFIDAIHTCRSLGIQYIWIDSLCIIQDSVPDWEEEAGSMHMVYKNAELMIAA